MVYLTTRYKRLYCPPTKGNALYKSAIQYEPPSGGSSNDCLDCYTFCSAHHGYPADNRRRLCPGCRAASAPVKPIPTVTPPPTPLPAPFAPELTVEPGTTEVTATWGAVDGAASYQVRWRHKWGDFADDRITTVADPTATFNVGEQGLWVVWVVACDDDGCGRGSTATTPVITNISGHQAVRIWFDYDPEAAGNVASAMHLDWDALPGYYIVKYRLTNNDNWVTSEPLFEVGYTLTADSFAVFEKRGKPIVSVFFNCNESGEQCTLLGRLPNTTMEQVDSSYVPPLARNTPGGVNWTNPYVPTPAPGATGDSSSGSAHRLEIAPLTHMLRPASDFTITTEVRDGVSYHCVSRAAENPWEKGMFGTGSDAVKSCSGGRTLDRYLYDPDAVFPDDATCGERPAETDRERSVYGDTVKVCNKHPNLDDNGGGSDDAGQGTAPDGGASGQSHSVDHEVDADRLLTWPNQHAQPKRGFTDCITV